MRDRDRHVMSRTAKGARKHFSKALSLRGELSSGRKRGSARIVDLSDWLAVAGRYQRASLGVET